MLSVPELIEQVPDLDRIALQNLVSACILQTHTAPDFERLKQLLQTVTTLVKANPHIQHYVFESFEHLIYTDESIDSTQHAQIWAETLAKIQYYLPAEDQDVQNTAKNIHIFYSLLAKYAQNPETLIRIIKQFEDARFDPQRIHFTLRLMSQFLNARHSLASVQTFVDTICDLTEEDSQLFTQMCQHPPYIPIQKWLTWHRDPDVDIQQQYQQFLLEPFGARRLDYTFNMHQYQRQRSLFHGLICNGEPFVADIFTDALGQLLNTTLRENRSKSPDELQHIFHAASEQQEMVGMLCAAVELLARTSSQQDLDSNRMISQECNTTQIMALYALLTHPTGKLFTQIDTGEGKSRIMMILAACKSATGYTVDFDTNDMQLVERDFFGYKDFFDTVDVETSMMTLQTPSFLYRKKGVNFSDT